MSDEYVRWCELIRELPRHHRKQWEYCYILQALSERDMLRFGRRGLGFGVGKEPLAAAMAELGCEIVATDQHAESAGSWALGNQHASAIGDLNDRGICDAAEFVERVKFESCDMNAIGSHLRNFDFTWSSCSFEHLGSIEAGLRFVSEQMKCLRSGGVGVHTTEFNVSSNDDTVDTGGTVLFRRRDLERLARKLMNDGHAIERLDFDLGDMPLDDYVDLPPYLSDRHLKLQIGRYVATSIGIIVRSH